MTARPVLALVPDAPRPRRQRDDAAAIIRLARKAEKLRAQAAAVEAEAKALARAWGYRRGYRVALTPEQVRREIGRG